MKKKLFILISLVTLSSYSAKNCITNFAKTSLNNKDFLLAKKFIRNNNFNKVATSQCFGSCYLEASLLHIERLVSKRIKKNIQINRVDIYKKMLISRIRSHYIRPIMVGNLQSFDLISGGVTQNVIYALRDKEIPIVSPKTQLQIYKENKLIKKINTDLIKDLAKIKKKHVDSLNRNKLAYIFNTLDILDEIEVYFNMSKKTSSFFKNYKRQLTNKNSSVYYKYSILVKFYEDIHLYLDKKHDKKFIKKIHDLGIAYFIKSDEISESIILDITNMINYQFKKYDFLVEELNFKNHGTISFNDAILTPIFNITEDYDIINNIDDFSNLLISHKYPSNIINSNPEHISILYKKESTRIIKGSHLMTIIDKISRDDQIIYLVIKNSWGIGRGHYGVELIHKSLFEYINNIYSISLVDLKWNKN